MNKNIVDFNTEKLMRLTDPDCIVWSDEGTPLFVFTLSYEYEGDNYSIDLIAPSKEEAVKQVLALRKTAKLFGRLLSSEVDDDGMEILKYEIIEDT